MNDGNKKIKSVVDNKHAAEISTHTLNFILIYTMLRNRSSVRDELKQDMHVSTKWCGTSFLQRVSQLEEVSVVTGLSSPLVG